MITSRPTRILTYGEYTLWPGLEWGYIVKRGDEAITTKPTTVEVAMAVADSADNPKWSREEWHAIRKVYWRNHLTSEGLWKWLPGASPGCCGMCKDIDGQDWTRTPHCPVCMGICTDMEQKIYTALYGDKP